MKKNEKNEKRIEMMAMQSDPTHQSIIKPTSRDVDGVLFERSGGPYKTVPGIGTFFLKSW